VELPHLLGYVPDVDLFHCENYKPLPQWEESTVIMILSDTLGNGSFGSAEMRCG
jgi:hypothetical protein